jgi:hypothetical protein
MRLGRPRQLRRIKILANISETLAVTGRNQ